MSNNRVAYALSAAAICGALVPLDVFAIDVSDKLVYNDAANGLSAVDIAYENGVTSLDVQVRFDGASIDKVLNQASGVNSTPGSFYATVNPNYGFTTPFGKGNFNYTPGVDEPNTPEEFEQGFTAQVDECSAYYQRWYGPNFSCNSWSYWSSNSSAFWQDYGYIQYKKDGNWITAPSDQVNFAMPTQASEVRSNRDRLVAALGLESADELEYGVNWRFVGDETATAWIYRDTKSDTYPVSAQNEYIKIHTTVEYVFDYMTLDANNNPIYHATLEDALASEDNTIILNKDTVVDTLNVPAGKTLIEREGELTILDPENSNIEGEYDKKGELELAMSGDKNDESASEEERAAIAEFVKAQTGALIASGESKNQKVVFWDDEENDIAGIEVLKNSLKLGRTLETTLWAEGPLDEDEWGLIEAHDEAMGLISQNEKIATVYEGGVSIYDSALKLLGTVFELDAPATVKFVIPEDLREAPAGYIREWTVIRVHMAADNTRSAERLTAEFDGENVVTSTDKFSSFVVVYEDVVDEEPVESEETTAPDTGTMTAAGASASIAAMAAAVTVGMLTSIVSFTYLMRRRG